MAADRLKSQNRREAAPQSCGTGSLAFVFLILIPAIAVISGAVYHKSLAGAFVYDDAKCVVENPVVNEFHDIGQLHDAVVRERWWHADYWGRPIADKLSHKSWRPLTTLTFMVEHALYGLNPYHYHLHNLVLHTLATVLVIFAARPLYPADTPMAWSFALVAGALFALHPMHSEAVSNITNRSEILSLCLQLLAFIVYTAPRRGSKAAVAAAVPATLLVLAASLCKETGIMGISLFVAYDFMATGVLEQLVVRFVGKAVFTTQQGPSGSSSTKASSSNNGSNRGQKRRGRSSKKDRNAPATLPSQETAQETDADKMDSDAAKHDDAEYLLSITDINSMFMNSTFGTQLAITIGGGTLFMLYRLRLQGEAPEWYSSTNPAANEDSFLVRATTYAYLHYFHFMLLLVPMRFCPDWRNTIDIVDSINDPRALQAIAFYSLLVAYIYFTLKFIIGNGRRRLGLLLTLALAWLVLPFLPASNALFPVGFVVAERVTYTPSVGFCYILSLVIVFTFSAYNPFHPSAGDIDGSKSTHTESVTPKQKSSFLQKMGVAAVGALVLAAYTAVLLKRDAEWGNEKALWTSATKSCPKNYVSQVLLGNVYDKEGDVDAAIQHYKDALEYNEYYMHANLNLGRMYREKKHDSRTAIFYLEKALMSADEPEAQAHVLYGLGLCHMDIGFYSKAVHFYEQVVQIAPHNQRYHYDLEMARRALSEKGDEVQDAPPPANTNAQEQLQSTNTDHAQEKKEKRKKKKKQKKRARKDSPEKPTAAEEAMKGEEASQANILAKQDEKTENKPMTAETTTSVDDAKPGSESVVVIDAVSTPHIDLINHGVDAAKEGNLALARRYFEAVSHQPSSPYAYEAEYKLGLLDVEASALPAAIAHFEASLALKDNLYVRFDYALALARERRMKDCDAQFKKLIEAASNLSPRYYYEWATVYYERDRTTKASQLYGKLVALTDEKQFAELSVYKAKGLVNLGVLAYKGGKIELARNLFQLATSLDPSHGAAKSNLAAVEKLLATQAQGQDGVSGAEDGDAKD